MHKALDRLEYRMRLLPRLLPRDKQAGASLRERTWMNLLFISFCTGLTVDGKTLRPWQQYKYRWLNTNLRNVVGPCMDFSVHVPNPGLRGFNHYSPYRMRLSESIDILTRILIFTNLLGYPQGESGSDDPWQGQQTFESFEWMQNHVEVAGGWPQSFEVLRGGLGSRDETISFSVGGNEQGRHVWWQCQRWKLHQHCWKVGAYQANCCQPELGGRVAGKRTRDAQKNLWPKLGGHRMGGDYGCLPLGYRRSSLPQQGGKEMVRLPLAVRAAEQVQGQHRWPIVQHAVGSRSTPSSSSTLASINRQEAEHKDQERQCGCFENSPEANVTVTSDGTHIHGWKKNRIPLIFRWEPV